MVNTDLRAASSKTKNNSFSLFVAATATKEWVLVASNKKISTVIDKDNLNLDITAEYVLQPSTFMAKHAGGGTYPAKLYIREHASPYGEITEHAITIIND